MNHPHVRTASMQTRLAEAVDRGMFEGAPHLYLFLTLDPRITGASKVCMAATLRRRDALVGFDMFDAFPNDPLDDQATGIRNLGAPFGRAPTSTRRDVMPLQCCEIKGLEGIWEIRYRAPVNWPIIDDAGSVIAIAHHVTDVSEQILASEPRRQRESLLFQAERACLAARRLVGESPAGRHADPLSARLLTQGSRD